MVLKSGSADSAVISEASPSAEASEPKSDTSNAVTPPASHANMGRSGASDTDQSQLGADALRRSAAASKVLAAAFGQIVSLLLRAPQYKTRAIADLEQIIVPAIVTGQYSVAEAQSKQTGLVAPVAVVLWASVSAEVDARLAEQVDQEIKLDPRQWKSGDTIWIVDAIGAPRVIEAMMERLAQKEWAGRSVKLWAKGKDGRWAVGTLHAKARETNETGAQASSAKA